MTQARLNATPTRGWGRVLKILASSSPLLLLQPLTRQELETSCSIPRWNTREEKKSGSVCRNRSHLTDGCGRRGDTSR